MSSLTRTSQTHPLRIATIPVGELGGAVGVTFAPGKRQVAAMTGIWKRDLATDLEVIREWGAHDLISLLEPQEFEELAISDLPTQASAYGLRWHGMPITDGAAPDHRFLDRWFVLGPQLAREICKGSRVVVHCKGGLGRAGTVACLLLLESGAALNADDAMGQVRAVRRGAIETLSQEAFLRAWPVQSFGASM
jgi:ADP-ribosyl-[dinitrogen reductase] hydrolase